MLLTSHISYFVRIQRSINRVGEGDEIAGFSPNIQAFYRRSQKRTHLENVFFSLLEHILSMKKGKFFKNIRAKEDLRAITSPD